ncbi:2-succinyl-5-enolpyruvyl-6-hydroxy-3-cyclohexene-1-carboxylic-acid synthase [Nakamurella silvestris]|nr:2-succinyl-5-enolpyruvyl-6-hydroxy-3-cyclohexene-1-carboxylic-acid synthase [Nakamurella silvestris]
MNPSTAFARIVVDELIACGVREVVLSPGSRNAPFSVALQQADQAGRLRLHVRIDERTAGFLAVGLARTSGRPAAVVTTSGTAVANLHPAVLEADASGVPLLVLTADRPPYMRDVGANQVVDQTGVFGSVLRFFHEFEVPTRKAGQNARWRSMICRALAYAGTCGDGGSFGAAGTAGPVQLNLPLAEPLLPDHPDAAGEAWPEQTEGRDGPWTEVSIGAPQVRPVQAPGAGERCLVIAELGHPSAPVLAAAGHPVISESSGLSGVEVLDAGMHLLADRSFLAAHRPDRIIVLGRPTLYRQVTILLTDPSRRVDLVAGSVGWRGIAGNARRVSPVLAEVDQVAPTEWAAAWSDGNARAAAAVHGLLDSATLADSPKLARELGRALPAEAVLMIGSSQPVRDIGLASLPRAGVTVTANRGVAGIDGTNSTAVGVALAHPGRTVAYVGDVTFLHDLTGLVLGPEEPRPDLTLVVSNNDGGGIFSTLEPGDPAHAESFERVFGTPHGADLGALARGAGASHTQVGTEAELAAELAVVPSGLRVVEVRTNRDGLRPMLAAFRESVAAALS